MHSKFKYFIFLSLLSVLSLVANANTPRLKADSLIAIGQHDKALIILDSLAAIEAKSAELRLLIGDCQFALNKLKDAEAAYKEANRLGAWQALLNLAKIEVLNYNIDNAQDYIAQYKAYIKKNSRKKLIDESSSLDNIISKTEKMLERVEKVAIIDSMIVDKAGFFEYYNLSPESGRLTDASTLPVSFSAIENAVVYRTEDNRKIIWASPSTDGVNLMTSELLLDNEWEEPEVLSEMLHVDGEVNFPFLLADGATLYFAADNENSLGGYDIYVSRHNGEEFLQPQNIGMPFNSPFDDYMMAIDETTGLGWWASDRNHLNDKLTIYIFIPEEIRTNIPYDDEQLAGKAMLTSIGLTQDSDFDYTTFLDRIGTIYPAQTSGTGCAFEIAMPDGTIIHEVSELKTSKAKSALARYLNLIERQTETQHQLSRLREKYSQGDKNVSQSILQLEKQSDIMRVDIRRALNDIVSAEFPSR